MGIRGKIQQSLEMDHEAIVAQYRDRPIEYLTKLCGRKYPQQLRRAFEDIYFERTRKAALKANRGGGKSTMMGDLASCFYLFKLFDCFILGGSENQSKKCYQYAAQDLQIDCRLDDFNATLGKIVARSVYGNWIEIAAASSRRVRGPHCGDPHRQMGMIQHGGLLEYDEECEMDDDISAAGKYTINTANPAIWVRASTLHKTVGAFSDLCSDPSAKGFTLYEWDCFDTAIKCEKECKNCRPDFSGQLNSDWTLWKKQNPDFIHDRGYCQGKAKSGGGWRTIWGAGDPASIEGSLENSNTRDEFEIEEMGLRPSGAGLVLNPAALELCLIGKADFIPGMPALVAIDWGLKGWAVVHLLQLQNNGIIVPVHTRYYHYTMDDVIYTAVSQYGEEYGVRIVCADGSHPYQNAQLSARGFKVHEVFFNQWKEMGAGWLKGLVEKRKLGIQGRLEGGKRWFVDGDTKRLYDELKGWRRGPDGKIVKKDDHGPDALLCAVAEWGQKGPWHADYAGTGPRETVTAGY